MLKSNDGFRRLPAGGGFSTLQRVEIAEIQRRQRLAARVARFSTLQRVEIAEMLLVEDDNTLTVGFSTLQRVEIAEIEPEDLAVVRVSKFQYSSTSRNC